MTDVTQYIGARYVPIFGRIGEDSIEWDNSKEYEPLTIVSHAGNSYTSRQYVPIGIDISNNAFWALTGNYNAQVEQYRKEVAAHDSRITANAHAIADEVTARETADTQIRTDFTAADTQIRTDFTAADTQIRTDFTAADTQIRSVLTKTFNTIEDMKAYTEFKVGDICKTLGFYTIGDGGSAYYKINNQGTANEIDIIQCSNSLVAEHVKIGEGIHVKEYGAYGDSTHDDTERIQKAIDNYNVVYIDAGDYHTTEPIILRDKVWVCGTSQSPYSARFLNVFSNGTFVLANENALSNISFNPDGQAVYNQGYCITGTNAIFTNLKELACTGGSYGKQKHSFLKMQGNWKILQMYRCIVDSAAIDEPSIYLENTINEIDPDIFIKECYLDSWHNTKGVIKFVNCGQAFLVNNTIRAFLPNIAIYFGSTDNFNCRLYSYNNYIFGNIENTENTEYYDNSDMLANASLEKINGKYKKMYNSLNRFLTKIKDTNMSSTIVENGFSHYWEPLTGDNVLISERSNNIHGIYDPNAELEKVNQNFGVIFKPVCNNAKGASFGLIFGSSVNDMFYFCFECTENDKWFVKLYKMTSVNTKGTALVTYGFMSLPDEIQLNVLRSNQNELSFSIGETFLTPIVQQNITNFKGIGVAILNETELDVINIRYKGYLS